MSRAALTGILAAVILILLAAVYWASRHDPDLNVSPDAAKEINKAKER